MPSTAIAAPSSMPNVMATIAAGSQSVAAATDATAGLEGSGAISADFASLLLAQLGGNPELPVGGELIVDKGTAELTEDDETATDGTDLSALFAALSLAQPAASSAPAPTAPVLADGAATALDGIDLQAQAPGAGIGAEGDAALTPLNGAGQGKQQGATGQQDDNPASFAAFEESLKQVEAQADLSAPTLPDAPPAVHAAHQAHGSASTTSSVAQARVDTPVRDPAFGQEFSQKIVWLAGQDKQSAQLTLNPPQLGPVEVSLKISGDQATAVFSSPHAEVREAIEAALPRLREMMGSAGLELGQANVSSQSFQQQQQQQAAQNQAGASRGGSTGGILGEGGNEPAAATGTVIRQSNGLVDTFA